MQWHPTQCWTPLNPVHYAAHAWTSTHHRREHRIPSGVIGSQLTLDAYSHGSSSYRGYRYGDLFTDISTGEVFPIMTKDRGAEELCLRASILFDSHPEWRSTGSDMDRFIRVDKNSRHHQCEGKPTHSSPTPRVPNKYWCLCMEYTCKTRHSTTIENSVNAFNYHRKLCQ
jgi:hypothetical protein